MSNFLSLPAPLAGGLPGNNPNVFSCVTTDSLETVTATGYLNDLTTDGSKSDIISAGDTLVIRYSANSESEAVTFGYAKAKGSDLNFAVGVIGAAGALSFQGTWDASTNTPTLSNPPESSTNGQFYIVSVAGTQFGLTFAVNDWIASNGSSWQKVDNGVGSLTGNRALVSNGTGSITTSTTTDTELAFVSGVTSAIQTQLNTKAPTASPTLTGTVTIGTAGSKLAIAEGANATMGTANLALGTVTVNTTAVAANSRIFLQHAAVGSSAGIGTLMVGTIVPGTSFVINSLSATAGISATDESTVNWLIIAAA